MHADVVNVSDERTSEGRLKAAKAFMKLGKYANAAEEFKRVTELTPQNYLGWLGLIESTTNNYSKRIKYNTERKILEDLKIIPGRPHRARHPGHQSKEIHRLHRVIRLSHQTVSQYILQESL